MIVVSPVRSDEHLKLPRHNLCEVMKSIGTDAYGQSCLLFLEQSLNTDQWALFRFRSGVPLKCVATASMHHRAAACFDHVRNAALREEKSGAHVEVKGRFEVVHLVVPFLRRSGRRHPDV